MSGQMGNTAQSDLLKLLFQNTNWANIGNAGGLSGSGAPGNFYVQLHTASPGAAGTQTTNESAYTGYARQAVARSSGGWTITGSSPTIAENAASVTFPQSSSVETETAASIGRDATLAGELLFFGPLTANLSVANLISPSFAANALQAQLT